MAESIRRGQGWHSGDGQGREGLKLPAAYQSAPEARVLRSRTIAPRHIRSHPMRGGRAFSNLGAPHFRPMRVNEKGLSEMDSP